MVLRKPLVTISGVTSELPPSDTIEGASVGSLTAGSGLAGGGSLASNQRVDVSLAAAPSGLIFVGNQLGLDGVAQSTADTALASGNAALSSAATALASGNAALAKTLIASSVNLSGGVSGAIPYQSASSITTFLNPGISGQVLATQGSNQSPTWITPGGGKILQVVQATVSTTSSTNSISFTATALSGTITPSSSSSRIYVVACPAGCSINSGGDGAFTIYRNTTNLGGSNGFLYLQNTVGGTNMLYPSPVISYVDSPSSTSATTYTLYIRSLGGVVFVSSPNNAAATSSIQLFEVSA